MPLKKFFDKHRLAGLSKLAIKHGFQFFLSLFEILNNQNTLAGSQTVGLEHVGGRSFFIKSSPSCTFSAVTLK